MFNKSFISGVFFFLLLQPAGHARSETEPIYAGWTVGAPAGEYGTILRSTDSGNTWVRQGAGQIADVFLSGVFAVDPYTAWVVGDQESGYGTIYHTTDGGGTWQRMGSSNTTSSDYVPNVEFSKVHAKGNDVWAVGTGTILHTSDGGATWTNHIPEAYEDVVLQGVFALDHDTAWVTGSLNSTGLILKTTDAGLTWSSQGGDVVGAAVHLLGISAADADVAWAVGSNYSVLKTTDGGTTWARDPVFSGFGDINEVYAVTTSIVWVATDNYIYWTTDGGETWDNSGNHGLAEAIAFMGISAVSNQKAWTSYCSSSGYIANTTDGGTNWTKIEQLGGEELPCLWTISFATQPLSPSLFIPAAATGPGLGESEWSTDVVVNNPGQNTLTCEIRFLAEGADNSERPADATFSLEPNVSEAYPDVVRNLIGIAHGSGALRFDVLDGGYLLMTSRTKNTDGDGATFGQGIPSVHAEFRCQALGSWEVPVPGQTIQTILPQILQNRLIWREKTLRIPLRASGCFEEERVPRHVLLHFNRRRSQHRFLFDVEEEPHAEDRQ